MQHLRYDVFGDIHGHKASLELALSSLGYSYSNGAWRHDYAFALFVGDFADRGPDPFGVFDLVAAMVRERAAAAVIGNHDFNLLALLTPNQAKPGRYLRTRTDRHVTQSQTTLQQAERDPARAAAICNWIKATPLLIEASAFRIVHACPETDALRRLSGRLKSDWSIGDNYPILADLASRNSTGDDRALVLSGPEYELPPGETYFDNEGIERTFDRVHWWRDDRYRGSVPTFFGHYALKGDVARVFPEANAVCVDAGCGKGGPLAVYTYRPNRPLTEAAFAYFPQI